MLHLPTMARSSTDLGTGAVRHPQYLGFMLILLGLLLQWPTMLTLAMFPVLAWMYVRLARIEEQEMQARFGEAYVRSVAGKPRFVPWPSGRPGRI